MSSRNKRRGLQKASCHACDAAIYLTWAQAEQHGMPTCACGEPFEPDDYELALALGLDDAASLEEYRRAVSSAMRGQAGHAHKWGNEHMRSVDEIADQRVSKDRRERARTARLNAIQPVNVEAMPF